MTLHSSRPSFGVSIVLYRQWSCNNATALSWIAWSLWVYIPMDHRYPCAKANHWTSKYELRWTFDSIWAYFFPHIYPVSYQWPMRNLCQLDPQEQTSAKFESKYRTFLSSFKETHLHMSSGKWQSYHLGIYVLICWCYNAIMQHRVDIATCGIVFSL